MDETFIGGKARNMHKHLRERKITGTGGKDKTMVVAVLDRGGKVRAAVDAVARRRCPKRTFGGTLNPALKSLRMLCSRMKAWTHQVVDHAVEYVKDHTHTNGLENFWSLLKRTINGPVTWELLAEILSQSPDLAAQR